MSSKPRELAGSRSLSDSVAHLLATVGGLGYAPVAPGTVGSLGGVVLFWWLRPSFVLGLITAVMVTLVGIWAATRVEKLTGERDPSRIVIDEVAGQFVTLWLAWSLGSPSAGLFSTGGLIFVAMGFLLFRLFDIVKPAPTRRLEKLRGGLGVVADDVMAGVYAGLTLHLIYRWSIL